MAVHNEPGTYLPGPDCVTYGAEAHAAGKRESMQQCTGRCRNRSGTPVRQGVLAQKRNGGPDLPEKRSSFQRFSNEWLSYKSDCPGASAQAESRSYFPDRHPAADARPINSQRADFYTYSHIP